MTYKTLKEKLHKNMNEYIDSKKAQTAEQLPAHRRPYVQILDVLIIELDKNRNRWEQGNKENVLRGFIHIVASLIPERRSTLRVLILKSLQTEDKVITKNDEHTAIEQARIFYNSITFPNNKIQNRVQDNLFSRIGGFNAKDFEKTMARLLSDFLLQAYEQSEEKKPQERSTTWHWPTLSLWSKIPPAINAEGFDNSNTHQL